MSPEDFAQQLGGTVSPALEQPHPEAALVSDRPWEQFWRSLYSTIPDVTGMLGGIGGATVGLAAGPEGAAIGGLAGAGAGGAGGRLIQRGIDYVGGRPEALQNPRSEGEEATRQMTFEGAGRVFSGLFGRFRGRLAPTTQEVADRLADNKRYGLNLSVGEITGSPAMQRVQRLAQRGIAGSSRQKAAQARTDAAAQKAVTSILDTLGTPGTTTGTGVAVQEAVQDAAGRGQRRLEGSVATNLAPKTGMGTSGQTAETGVQAGRTAFTKQGEAFGQMVNEAPPVDMTSMHQEAWRIFNEEIMPTLIENPASGPKSAEWQKIVRMYRQASARGERLELSPATLKALSDAALEKAPYGPLRVINQVLATPAEMSFRGALGLRGTLRDAGKGTELLAGDKAEALATFFETGGRTGEFSGLRGLLNETHAPYEAAAEAYRTNRNLFQSTFIQKVAESNPESVLSTLTNAEGRMNASRVRELSQVLNGLPKTYGNAEEIAQGKKAWDTLRAEWFRRDVMQDNVFGLSDRMKKVDPDVLAAWFPDLQGKNVLKQATVTANAFESHFLSQIAEADPAKIVDMIGASPARVNEFVARINGLPGPVQKAQLIDRVRRSWTEELAAGDPSKLSERIQKTDPDLLKAWFVTPADQQALANLRRIGSALETRQPVQGMGAYESLGAVSVIGNVLRGNIGGALKTALGFEGIPAFVSWAMYNPSVQQYLFEAAAPAASVTSKTAALLHALGAYRAAAQERAQ